MKRSIIALALLTLVVTFAFGQMKQNDSVEAQIVALEKSAFEAWKNKEGNSSRTTCLKPDNTSTLME
jgi:hypothetical protein